MKCTLRSTERSCNGLDPYVKYEIVEGRPWQNLSRGAIPLVPSAASYLGDMPAPSISGIVLGCMALYDVVRLCQNVVCLLHEASAHIAIKL